MPPSPNTITFAPGSTFAVFVTAPTPVVTPHFDDHSIDREKFAEVLEFLIERGINAALIAGTTGEYYAQSPEERYDLMRLAKEIIGDRLPLIVGTGAMRTEDSVAYAEAAKAAGAEVTVPLGAA